jgi:peptidylprolyl isomerase
MKFITTLLFASIALAPSAAVAQKAAATTHTASPTHTTGASMRGCVKVPELSPKIPALPATAACAKALYTIKTMPSVSLIDVSPLETPDLADALGIPAAATFTLAYIDSKTGTGELAVPHKWYSIKYTGYIPDGYKFDSSDDHPGKEPLTFQQGPSGAQGRRQMIVGVDTGIDGMRVGGKRRLFIPFQLAYGPNGNPAAKIPPKTPLIFDIELVAVSDKDPSPKPPSTPPAPPSGSGSSQPASPAKPTSSPISTHPAPAASTPPAPAASAPPATAPATPPKSQ